MTIEERLADLEQRMAAVERVTIPLMPLGPRQDWGDLDHDRKVALTRISASLLEELKR